MPNFSVPDSTIFNMDICVLNNFIQRSCCKVSFAGGAKQLAVAVLGCAIWVEVDAQSMA
jgi:hypothetical protein